MDEMDTEAGAVMYQICFPSKLDFLNNFETLEESSIELFSKPRGGLKGAGCWNVTVFAACLKLELARCNFVDSRKQTWEYLRPKEASQSSH